ncbi:uncharacterized protein LOC111493024 [Cucurbita maxima]|uniref:Uncharacterized protein LOC111493024 n=1 Tax=Cucurbita maxima TaxID=3661 RepID=A0A6J1KGI2_CUCMA|nr:uncharacterized protein LOC111493024 [Cucurbita maxima]
MRRIGGPRERSKIGNLWRFNRFIDNRCLAPLTLDGDGDVDALRRRPYRLLPRLELIDLFVLKLDGSVFGVRVARNGTVADLKQAIEEVFDSPRASEHCKITWSLVWGHFCLCYEGEKLIDDKAYIRVVGIKDGDQLQFIRHMSINCLPMKRDRKNQAVPCKTVLFLPAESKSIEGNQVAGQGDPVNYEVHEDGSNQEEIPMAGFQLANIFRGRLLYSKIWGFFRSASEGRNRPSSGFCIT